MPAARSRRGRRRAARRTARTPSGVTVTIRARHFVAAGGALNTPALLLRSQLPDPHKLLGTAHADPPGGADDGASCPSASTPSTARRSRSPRTTSSGWTAPPGRWATSSRCRRSSRASARRVFNALWRRTAQGMADLPHANAVLALLRDGFVPQSVGGSVRLADDGSPILDYDISATTCGKARAAPGSAWPSCSLPPARSGCAWRTSMRPTTDQLGRGEEGHRRAAAEEVPRHACSPRT